MVNLHYNYVQQLVAKAKNEIESFHHRDAIKYISKAFSHLEVLAESSQIRGDVPLSNLEKRRIELIDLVNQLPPTCHY